MARVAVLAGLLLLAVWAGCRFATRSVGCERERRARECALESAVAAEALGVALVDRHQHIVWSNAIFQRTVGYGDEALANKSLTDLLHDDDAGRQRTLFQELVSGSCSSYTREYPYLRADGNEVWMRFTMSRIPADTAEAPVAACTFRDLTLERQLLDVQQGEEASERLQRASHDTLYASGVVLAKAATLAEALPRLLQTIGEGLLWDAVLFWKPEPQTSIMECSEIWHVSGKTIAGPEGKHSRTGVGPALSRPGRVWATGIPAWSSDLANDPEYNRGSSNPAEQFGEAFWLPIRVDGTVYGVLELLRYEPAGITSEIEAAMRNFSEELGRMAERKQAEQTLRESEERYRSIAESAKDAVITIDEQGLVLSTNTAAELMFGYARAELVGQPITVLMPENQRESHRQGLRRYVESGQRRIKWDLVELPGLRRDGGEMLLEMSFVEFTQHGRRTFTAFVRDITDQRHAEAALTYQALHDSLTDLPNRTLLRDRLEQAVLVAKRHGLLLALLFMDLDRFKEVNDTLGHHSGDLLLQQVASRLRSALRESDTIARLGGDEFAVLLPATDESGARLAAERILAVLSQPFALEGQNFEINGSIGITLYPDHGDDASTMMRRADVAMYAAKRADSGYALYSPEQDEHVPGRLTLTRELRRAIEDDQLLLFYQPKIDLATNVTRDVEGLMRWLHPERGLMPPDEFISLAEETGLIRPLTTWAINAALDQYRAQQLLGFDIRVAVNLSARTLHDPRLVATVADLLETWRLDPSALQLEITESAIMVHPDRALKTLKQLHSTGVSISIDDFGTGYSSLAYLKGLPVQEIKIDKTFVLDMALNRDDASIVRSIIDLGHNLGLQVVAEGVENKRTLDMLRDFGCDMAQGYFLCRPIPAEDLAQWLTGTARIARAS